MSFRDIKRLTMEYASVKGIVLGLVGGLIALLISVLGQYELPPGSDFVIDSHEIFILLGAALTGPLGGIVTGIIGSLAGQQGEAHAYTLVRHAFEGLWIGWAYKRLVHDRLRMPFMVLGWSGIVIAFDVVFPALALAAVWTVDPSALDPNFVAGSGYLETLQQLLSAYMPEVWMSLAVTTAILVALPREKRQPWWGRHHELKSPTHDKNSPVFRGLRPLMKRALVLRISLWFIILTVFPLVILGLKVQTDVTGRIAAGDIRTSLEVARFAAVACSAEDRRLPDVLRSFGERTKERVGIIDRNGIYTAHTDSSRIGTSMTDEFPERFLEASFAKKDGFHLEKTGRAVFSFAAVPGTDLVAIAAKRTDTGSHALADITWTIYGDMGLTLVLVALVAGIIVWVVITDPLRQLTEAAGKVSSGIYDVNVDTKDMDGEIRQLGDAFNEMALNVRKANANLTRREAKYRELFERVPVGLFRSTPAGEILDVNTAFKSMLKCPAAEDMSGRNASELYVDPNDRVEWSRTLQRQGVVPGFETRLRCCDGSHIWARLTGKVVRDESGAPMFYEGAVEDISEEKRSREALIESEHRFRSLSNASFEGIGVTREGVIVDANQAMMDMLRCDGKTLIGMRAFDFVAPESRDIVERHIRQGIDEVYEHEALRSDGSRFRAEVRSRTIQENGGALRITAIRDVTIQRQIERDRLATERQYKTLFETSADAIFIMREELITECNNRALEMFACERGDLIGQSLATFSADLRPDGRSAPEVMMDKIRAALGGAPQSCEWEYMSKSGSLVDAEVSLIPLDLTDGIGVQAIVRDITGRKRSEDALRKSEELYRRLVDAIPDVIVRTDLTGTILFANDVNLPDGSKLSATEFIGRNVLEFVASEDMDRAVADFKGVTTMGIQPSEYKLVLPGGIERMCDMNGGVLRDDKEEAYGYVLTYRDITEKKKSEKSMMMLAHALRSIQESITITDMKDRLLFVNEAFEKMYGYSSDEILGEPISIVGSSSNDPSLVAQILPATIAGGWQGELINNRKDGSSFPISLSTTVIRDESGEPMALIGVGVDITDRKRAEDQLKEQAALLDISPDAIIRLSLDDTILFWNKGAEELYGWTKDEVFGKKSMDVLQHEKNGEIRKLLSGVVREDHWTGEMRHQTRGGKDLIVESRWTIVKDKNGTPVSILVVNTDLTRKKTLEEQLLRSQRLESIGTLAGGIAHDLNNVLGPVLLSIEYLESRLKDPTSRSLLNSMESSVKRGSGIVKQILSFARGVEGERGPLNLKHVVNEIRDLLKQTFPKNLQMEYAIPRNLWLVNGDMTQLHQVFMNLCVNARDAMPHGGTLSIAASNIEVDEAFASMQPDLVQGTYVRITISDTGEGMTPKIRARIFDPFFTTKEPGKGTGLGLSTVIGIVKSHGGFLDVDSEPGEGSTFNFYLPAVEGEEIMEKRPKRKSRGGKGIGVLIVDDEATLTEVMGRTLEEGGYTVFSSLNGPTGVALLAGSRDEIQLAIVDQMMPVMDGHSTMRALRQISPDLCIVVISGLDTDIEGIRAEFGPVGFLRKPFTAGRLMEEIESVLIAKERGTRSD